MNRFIKNQNGAFMNKTELKLLLYYVILSKEPSGIRLKSMYIS